MSSPSPTSQVAVSLLFLGSLCLIAFHLIGSSIDSDGMLHEPFALIPIGLWLVVAARWPARSAWPGPPCAPSPAVAADSGQERPA